MHNVAARFFTMTQSDQVHLNNVHPSGANFKMHALTAKVIGTNLLQHDCFAWPDAKTAIYACQVGLRILTHAEKAVTPKCKSQTLAERYRTIP